MISVRSGGWVLPWAGPPQRNRVLSPPPWAADEAPTAPDPRPPGAAPTDRITGHWTLGSPTVGDALTRETDWLRRGAGGETVPAAPCGRPRVSTAVCLRRLPPGNQLTPDRPCGGTLGQARHGDPEMRKPLP